MSRRRRTTIYLPPGMVVGEVRLEGTSRDGAPVTVRITANRVVLDGFTLRRSFPAGAPSTPYLCDLLARVDRAVPSEQIDRWSEQQRRNAEAWATALHLRMHEHDDVVVPPEPSFVASSSARAP